MFGCYAVMGENMIRGSQRRRGVEEMERGVADAGGGGRVSEEWWRWWVMKYSVRICLWLLPSFFSFDISG